MEIRYQLTEHAHDMVEERDIKEEWLISAIEQPDNKESREDQTIHYVKLIKEHGGRSIRVVVNPKIKPMKIVTVFFDRRLRSKNEIKS